MGSSKDFPVTCGNKAANANQALPDRSAKPTDLRKYSLTSYFAVVYVVDVDSFAEIIAQGG